MSKSQKITLIGGVMAAVLGSLVTVIWEIYKNAEDRQHYEIENRAYISINATKARFVHDSLEFYVTFINSGNTPAHNVRVASADTLSSVALSWTSINLDSIVNIWSNNVEADVGKGVERVGVYNKIPVTVGQLEAIRKKEQKLYIILMIKYEDEFNKLHSTNCSLVYDVDGFSIYGNNDAR